MRLEIGQNIKEDFTGQFDALWGVEVKGEGPMAFQKK
jgi:hypothetical protein